MVNRIGMFLCSFGRDERMVFFYIFRGLFEDIEFLEFKMGWVLRKRSNVILFILLLELMYLLWKYFRK